MARDLSPADRALRDEVRRLLNAELNAEHTADFNADLNADLWLAWRAPHARWRKGRPEQRPRH